MNLYQNQWYHWKAYKILIKNDIYCFTEILDIVEIKSSFGFWPPLTLAHRNLLLLFCFARYSGSINNCIYFKPRHAHRGVFFHYNPVRADAMGLFLAISQCFEILTPIFRRLTIIKLQSNC